MPERFLTYRAVFSLAIWVPNVSSKEQIQEGHVDLVRFVALDYAKDTMIMPCLAQPFVEPNYQRNPCFAAAQLHAKGLDIFETFLGLSSFQAVMDRLTRKRLEALTVHWGSCGSIGARIG